MKKIRFITVFPLVILLALALSGCSRSTDQRDAGNLDLAIEGSIKPVEQTDENTLVLTISADEGTASQYDEAIVRVDDTTGLERLEDKYDGNAGVFSHGGSVKVYYDGTATKSMPPQLTAKLIQFN